MNLRERINEHLGKIYQGVDLIEAKTLFAKLLIEDWQIVNRQRVNEQSTYLITYGDSFYDGQRAPLAVLGEVLEQKLPDFTDIHLLPIFPYTSDDGFSVLDYQKIDPVLGTWADIEQLAQRRRLMFDFVCNHISKSSDWFQRFLRAEPDFKNSFIEFDAKFDTSNVTRPRTSALFHKYGTKQVWTTFSEDQVDNNVRDPKVLIRLTRILMGYIQRGASSIRLDAIGFLWKASGTTSMHLPQTHEVIKLWRTMINNLAPNVQIITETNVPHAENLSYFGDGEDEANMVYQFPLPPLVLHTFISGNSAKLSRWAETIHPISESATYFNFLASHDGIGLRPVENILTKAEREQIVAQVRAHAGKVSYKSDLDGNDSPYELNINYSEALGSTAKMIAAHFILLSFIGVPAIYYHSIFGSKNDVQAVEETGISRRINRERLDMHTLFAELELDGTRKMIFEGLSKLIAIRKQEPAFNPYGEQKILKLGEAVFALERSYAGEKITAIVNISDKVVELGVTGFDLISQSEFFGNLPAYQFVWIKSKAE
ncbi:alpha-amylase [Weissella muntiaci]|uniref:Sucrose phosphorylase n=1 Tax=Weissella muntiaci TaxID=2508881 RepID=A0A6C2CCD2_9LACO|nr:alpha-amylase family glycosyl hydrolase [Weissella muntiaci]TYC50805.1 alpha-amylase [Weissella muntiaci]